MKLTTLIEQQGVRKAFKGEISDTMTKEELEIATEQIIEQEETEELSSLMPKIEAGKSTSLALVAATDRAAKDIVSYLSSVDKGKERGVKEAEQKKQKEQLDEIRKQAKEQAAAIKERVASAQVKGYSTIFTVGNPTITAMRVVTEPPVDPEVFNEPFFCAENDSVKLFNGDQVIQKQSGKYGSKYKQAKDIATSGRAQEPLTAAGGKDVARLFFKQWMPNDSCMCDISSVQGGPEFMDTIWQYGVLPWPSMSFIGITPNGAAMLRVLSVGTVNVACFHLQSLATYTNETRGPALESLDYFNDGFGKHDAAALAHMQENGVKIRFVTQKSGSLLYVPQGWVVVESSEKGSQVISGIRKSFMLKSPVHTQCFRKVKELMAASGRNISRMESILELMVS